jgi:glycosyltransferase involved in cell wall biosynthesis
MSRRLVLFTPGHMECGGASTRARLIATELAERGWDVCVITRSGTLHRPRWAQSKGLRVLEIPGFGRRRLGGVLFLAFAVPLGLVWGRRATALLSIQLMSTSTAAAICALTLRRPFIAMATTSGKLSEARYISSTRTSCVRCRLLGGAAFVVAQTNAVARELAAVVDPAPVAVIPNPVRIPEAAPALTGKPRALFAGRVSREKDLDRLLTAWRSVAASNSEARLTLAGEGGQFRSVETEIQARVATEPILRRTVGLLGWVADVHTVLADNDVFVLPSLEEGMSNALLEACAWGRVVVASDIPANRAVLGDDYPLLFPPGDTHALSTSLQRAFTDDPLRLAASNRLRARAESFSTNAVLPRLEALIDAAYCACN